MAYHEELFTELTPNIQASICGGVNTQPTKNEPEQSPAKVRIGRGRARILYELGEKLPDRSIRNENGECRPYFDPLTGQFTFSCVLRNPGVFGDEIFPDL